MGDIISVKDVNVLRFMLERGLQSNSLCVYDEWQTIIELFDLFYVLTEMKDCTEQRRLERLKLLLEYGADPDLESTSEFEPGSAFRVSLKQNLIPEMELLYFAGGGAEDEEMEDMRDDPLDSEAEKRWKALVRARRRCLEVVILILCSQKFDAECAFAAFPKEMVQLLARKVWEFRKG
jgi:hypothetical protein